MNNFWTRAITGAVFVIVLVGAIVMGGWFMKITFGFVVVFGLLEFYDLFKESSSKPQKITGTILGGVLYFAAISIPYHERLILGLTIGLILSGIMIIGILELFRAKEKPFENIALTYAGVAYVVIPFILLNLMVLFDRSYWDYNYWPVLSIFILIWSNDTFAYLTGKLIGKHKLFERISPKKTWEGFIGGIVFAITAGVLIAHFTEQSYPKYILYAIIAGVIGTAGDLVESMLKRSLNIKDSGTILPGHGGILDRFDGVLFVAPVIFALELVIFR
jgi:phosphatidate cytidylyltransferase